MKNDKLNNLHRNVTEYLTEGSIKGVLVREDVRNLINESRSLQSDLDRLREETKTKVDYYEDKLESMQRSLDMWFEDLQKEKAVTLGLREENERFRDGLNDCYDVIGEIDLSNGMNSEIANAAVRQLEKIKQLLENKH